jgi:hypothetical protein
MPFCSDIQAALGAGTGAASPAPLHLQLQLRLSIVDFALAAKIHLEALPEAAHVDPVAVAVAAGLMGEGVESLYAAAALPVLDDGARSTLEEGLLKGGMLLRWLKHLHVFDLDHACLRLLPLAASMLKAGGRQLSDADKETAFQVTVCWC